MPLWIGTKKKRRLAALPKIGPETTEECSAWWGRDGLILQDYAYISPSSPLFGGELADIGVGRLIGFDPNSVSDYPKFKQDTPDLDTAAAGTMLCKLGFPFYAATPSWNGSGFVIPPIPIARFPIEGMFTRTCVIEWRDPNGNAVKAPFPFKYIETSSPGLKGQSGGPTFDVNGTIWAIQAKTQNLPLGFDPSVPGKKNQTEHQFLNVGLGVHPTTMHSFFRERKISFELAPY